MIEESKEGEKPTQATSQVAKQKASEAEQEAAREIIAKFGVEYSQIKLDRVNELVKSATELHLFGK